MKILLTGGSGLLGRELAKYLKFEAPTHQELDITNEESVKNFANQPARDSKSIDLVVHCAAYTNVAKAEHDKVSCFEVNVVGTYNLLKAFPSARFVYISSEYAKNPVNYYSRTKKWGEEMVTRFSHNSLIIRTLFKKNPFEYEEAFFDQYTGGDYIDVIAPMIAKEIIRDISGTIYVGTGRKTMFELARRTKPEIKGISVKDLKSVILPEDYV